MAPLPPYVTGSTDRRTFMIDGHVFFVYRSRWTRELGFMGIGRDGDYAPDDAPQFGIINRLLAGISSIGILFGTSCTTDSEETLEAVERIFAAAAGGYRSLAREAAGDLRVAVALLALPLAPGMARSIYFCNGFAITVRIAPTGEATVDSWAWGRDPGPFVETTLVELGATPKRVGGSDVGKQFELPSPLLAPFLTRALAHLGPGDVRLNDG